MVAARQELARRTSDEGDKDASADNSVNDAQLIQPLQDITNALAMAVPPSLNWTPALAVGAASRTGLRGDLLCGAPAFAWGFFLTSVIHKVCGSKLCLGSQHPLRALSLVLLGTKKPGVTRTSGWVMGE